MAVSVEQAVQERPAAWAKAVHTRTPPLPATAAALRAGTDGMDFVRNNRIHVQDGSLFIDPYLVVHPRELDPKNETALRAKMQLTYGINNPSFYEAPERVSIALNLGQLVPVSLGAKRSKLLEEVKRFNTQVDSGADAALQKQADDKRNPFTAIVRDTVENPEVDPVGLEVLKNGLGMYLLLREKLTQNHFLNKLTDYVNRSNTPDQVLSDLADKTGLSPRDIREAALKGGLDGVGKLLGLDPRYVADVKQVSEYAASHDFGYNLIEHWHLGRQLLGMDAPLQEKITTGMDARITAKIDEYRTRVRHHYDVPEPVAAEETRIAREDMSVLEPIQRQLLFSLGYELCHTNENTADAIAFHKGIYGLHRKAANDLSDINGTYRIYYSGHGSLKGSVGTLAHEVAHNFWPSYFDAQQVKAIDTLANSDAVRFTQLQHLLDKDFDGLEALHQAYKAGNAQEKAAIIATANERFAPYGITVDGLFPSMVDAKSLRFLVWDANDVLQVEGGRYNRSGYDTPQERFREIISRYAEMRQVSYRDNPDLLRFVAPGLTQVWEAHYIPHLEKVYQDVAAHQHNAGRGGKNHAETALPAQAANDEPPASETLPKVDERTQQKGTPVNAAAEKAGMPSNQVLGSSVQLDPLKVAGLSALKEMGISAA